MPETEELTQLLEELRAIPTPKPADPFMELMARTASEARALRDSLIPAINVEPPVVHVAAPEVRVDVPDQSSALLSLVAMIEQLASAFAAKDFSVTVNVPKQPTPQVNVEMPPHMPMSKKITVERGKNGLIESATVTEE